MKVDEGYVKWLEARARVLDIESGVAIGEVRRINDEIRAALQGKEGLFYFRLIYESHLENKKKEGK